MQSVRMIPKEIVQERLTFETLIPSMKRAMAEFSSRKAAQPLRTVLWMENGRRQFIMPSYSMQEDVLATKLISIYPDCADRGLPIRNSYMCLFNSDDGTLECIMETEPMTWMRTAAASVAATQTILKHPIKVLGVLGTGNQAACHVRAFSKVYPLEEIKVWSRNPDNVAKLCHRLKDIAIVPCDSAKAAVTDADVVITATSSTEPVLRGSWLKTGCHVNGVGAIRSTWREFDDECMNNAVIYTDSTESAEKESGDIILSKANVYAEIGEVISGIKPPKYGKFTVFKSMGIAMEDAHAAKLVWNSILADDDKGHEVKNQMSFIPELKDQP